jgi:hypothetical protein
MLDIFIFVYTDYASRPSHTTYFYENCKKSKAVPLTGYETSRIPYILDNLLTDGGEDVS